MPRVSENYRRARRDEIARAAIRCLERKGVHDTSIADIVEESGLSTGAIYSHFTSKSELARYIVAEFLFPRLHELERSADVRVAPRAARDACSRSSPTTGFPPASSCSSGARRRWAASCARRCCARRRDCARRSRAPCSPGPARGRRRMPRPRRSPGRRTRAVIALAQGYVAQHRGVRPARATRIRRLGGRRAHLRITSDGRLHLLVRVGVRAPQTAPLEGGDRRRPRRR